MTENITVPIKFWWGEKLLDFERIYLVDKEYILNNINYRNIANESLLHILTRNIITDNSGIIDKGLNALKYLFSLKILDPFEKTKVPNSMTKYLTGKNVFDIMESANCYNKFKEIYDLLFDLGYNNILPINNRKWNFEIKEKYRYNNSFIKKFIFIWLIYKKFPKIVRIKIIENIHNSVFIYKN